MQKSYYQNRVSSRSYFIKLAEEHRGRLGQAVNLVKDCLIVWTLQFRMLTNNNIRGEKRNQRNWEEDNPKPNPTIICKWLNCEQKVLKSWSKVDDNSIIQCSSKFCLLSGKLMMVMVIFTKVKARNCEKRENEEVLKKVKSSGVAVWTSRGILTSSLIRILAQNKSLNKEQITLFYTNMLFKNKLINHVFWN